jgi:UDP-perosamine 4-acetyltransferase
MLPVCIILGGGGHARMLIDALLLSGAQVSLGGVLDPDQAQWGGEVLGVRVVGGDEELPRLAAEGATCFVVGLGGTRNNAPRRRLFDFGIGCGLSPLTVIHPAAHVSTRAVVGAGAQILPGAIVNMGATLGANVIVNSGAIVEHDCVIGDHVHVATGARLASTVRVGQLAHIGAGATVRQCVTIGEGAVVGAGAVVVGDVAPFTVVVGVPARPMREAKPKT